MNIQHTPGPWIRLGEMIVQDSNGPEIATVATRANWVVDGATRVANARLIAAAPELLAALEELSEYSDALRGSAVHGRVARAIARARGK